MNKIQNTDHLTTFLPLTTNTEKKKSMIFITGPELKKVDLNEFTARARLVWTRNGGWELWLKETRFEQRTLVAGEWHDGGIKVEINGQVIVDNLSKKNEENDD